MRTGHQHPVALGDLARLAFSSWRLRRVTAGLHRAAARGDDRALARWAARGRRALDEAEPMLMRMQRRAKR